MTVLACTEGLLPLWYLYRVRMTYEQAAELPASW